MMGGTPNFDRPADQDPAVLEKTIANKILEKQRRMFQGFNIEDTIFGDPGILDAQRKSNLTPAPEAKKNGTKQQGTAGTIYDKG